MAKRDLVSGRPADRVPEGFDITGDHNRPPVFEDTEFHHLGSAVMANGAMQFQKYEDTFDQPNIVVDGSPNAATVLTLTHWPGIAQPAGLGRDSSAEMAFAYLDEPPDHEPANMVTNNHFDQDGLVSAFALIDPDQALAHRELLIDVAAAGDFATYRHRSAARASMAVWSYAQPDRSPLGDQLNVDYPDMCALLYLETLPLLLAMATEPARFRDLWHDEDEQLTRSEAAVADGRVTIKEIPAADLAIVRINDPSLQGGHRFGSNFHEWVHPMAIHNATDSPRLLLVRGDQYRYADRYETWVQYRTRRLPQRVDLGALATELTAEETGATIWKAKPPSVLTPTLDHAGSSSLGELAVVDAVVSHLHRAPPAWDPFAT